MGEIADVMKERRSAKCKAILRSLIESEKRAQQEYKDAMEHFWDDNEMLCKLSEIFGEECEHQEELEELLNGKKD